MFFSLFLLCISIIEEEEDEDESIDALVTKFNSFEFGVEEGEIREIQFDRNNVTVIFPPIDGVTVTVFALVDGGKVEVGTISENKFGVHCGKELCLFQYKSDINTTGKVHILSDTNYCQHTFISSKLNENFRVSNSNSTTNISLSQANKICFLHIPNQEIQYTASLIAKAPAQKLDFNVSIFENDESNAISLDLKKQKIYKNKVNSSLFVELESNSDSTGTFVYMSQKTNPNIYQESFDEFVLEYEQNDSMFFLTTNGPEDIKIPDGTDDLNAQLELLNENKNNNNDLNDNNENNKEQHEETEENENNEEIQQQENPIKKNGRFFDQGVLDQGLTDKNNNKYGNKKQKQENINDDDDESNQIWQDLIREDINNDEDNEMIDNNNEKQKELYRKKPNINDNEFSIKREKEKIRERRGKREKEENYNVINPDDNEKWRPGDDLPNNNQYRKKQDPSDDDDDFVNQIKPKIRKGFGQDSVDSNSNNNSFILALFAILIALIVIAIAGFSTFIVVQYLRKNAQNDGESMPLLNSHNQNQGYPMNNMQFNPPPFPNYQFQGMGIPQQPLQANFPNLSQ